MGTGALALRGSDWRRRASAARSRRAEHLRERVEHSSSALETLDYLRKGGRISAAKAAIGGLLSVKPIITVDDGLVVAADQPRTRAKARERVIELMTDRPRHRAPRPVLAPADADASATRSSRKLPGPARKRRHDADHRAGHRGPRRAGRLRRRRCVREF